MVGGSDRNVNHIVNAHLALQALVEYSILYIKVVYAIANM